MTLYLMISNIKNGVSFEPKSSSVSSFFKISIYEFTAFYVPIGHLLRLTSRRANRHNKRGNHVKSRLINETYVRGCIQATLFSHSQTFTHRSTKNAVLVSTSLALCEFSLDACYRSIMHFCNYTCKVEWYVIEYQMNGQEDFLCICRIDRNCYQVYLRKYNRVKDGANCNCRCNCQCHSTLEQSLLICREERERLSGQVKLIAADNHDVNLLVYCFAGD